MSPFIFIPLAFFGTCATLTIIFIFCARELREQSDEVESEVSELEAQRQSWPHQKVSVMAGRERR